MNPQASIEIDSLHDGVDLYSSVTRAKFEDLCGDLFKRTIDHVARAIADAGLDKSAIDEVVVVGGSSRIPKIQQLLQDFFDGKELCKSINPEEAIAYGATVQVRRTFFVCVCVFGHAPSHLILFLLLQAALLAGIDVASLRETLVVDILPLSLGVESSKGVMTTLIRRKSPIPTKRTMTFSTVQHNQENVLIKVFEGERLKTKNNKLLGYFELVLDPRPRGVPQIEVNFEIDASGVLSVSAQDRSTEQREEIKVTRLKSHLTPGDIEEMIAAAESYQSAPLF